MAGPHPPEDPASHYNQAGAADRYARTFDSMRPTPAQYARFDRFVRLLPPHGTVLDAGCGTGRFGPAFLERGLRVVGIDASRAMLGVAKKLAPRGGFCEMDLRRLGFADATFDGVWTVAVVLHLGPDALAHALTEMRRVLKPDGILFLATRTTTTEKTVTEPATEGGVMIVHYYTEKTLAAGLARAGIEVLLENQEPDDLGRRFDYVYLLAGAAAR